MKITRRQLRKIINEATAGLSDYRLGNIQNSLIFLEYLEGFIKQGSMSPEAKIYLFSDGNDSNSQSVENTFTAQEILPMIPGIINQLNIDLGGTDTGAPAAEVKDSTYSAIINPATGQREIRRNTVYTKHSSLTIEVPILLHDKVTFLTRKGYESSTRSFILHIYVPFDGKSCHMVLSENAYLGEVIQVIDMQLDESRFDFALEILAATNDMSVIGEFLNDVSTQNNLPIYKI